MRKFQTYFGPAMVAIGIGLAAGVHLIEHAVGQATAVALAGGVFTIALAVYIQD